jgi:hypothetical protein
MFCDIHLKAVVREQNDYAVVFFVMFVVVIVPIIVPRMPEFFPRDVTVVV